MKVPLKSFKNFALDFALAATLLSLSAATFATTPPKPQTVKARPTTPISIAVYRSDIASLPAAIEMYPKPDKGMDLHLLTLDKLANEAQYKIEIEIGVTAQLDCNKHRLTGEIKRHSLQGWGYPYYRVDGLKMGASTRMACLHGETATNQFVSLPKSLMLDYDSRLPKVFYLPEGAVLRYKIWQSSKDYHYSPSKAALKTVPNSN